MGETNANLSLNFQQEENAPSEGRRSPSVGRSTPSRKHRDGTPSRRHKSKSREGSPRKSLRSRTATPTQELLQTEAANGVSSRKSSRSDAMDTSELTPGKYILFYKINI